MENNIWTCNFCKQSIIKGKNGHEISTHLFSCIKFKYYKNNILTKDFLYNEYIVLEKSAKEIANDHKLSSAISIIKLLKKYEIPLRNIQQSKMIKRCKEKVEASNLKNSGFKHNFCKNHPSRKKWEKRLMDDENRENVFQRESVKEKIKETCLKKYGVTHHMKNKDIQEKICQIFLKKYGTKYPITKSHGVTIPHLKIIYLLQNNNIDFEIEQGINDKYWVDILLPNKKIIEIYGDFWHANPIKYKDTDVLNFPGKLGGYKLAKEIWDKDEKRTCYLKNQGYDVFIVWEKDINNDLHIVKEQIWKFLKLNQ